MKFGNDMWLWLRFLVAIIRLIKELFGDDEDKKDVEENGDPFNEKKLS